MRRNVLIVLEIQGLTRGKARHRAPSVLLPMWVPPQRVRDLAHTQGVVQAFRSSNLVFFSKLRPAAFWNVTCNNKKAEEEAI